MRKRVINHVADTIFWYILYFLPVLAYLFFVVSAPFSDYDSEVADTSDYCHLSAYTLPAGYEFEGFNPLNASLSFGWDCNFNGNSFFAKQNVTFVLYGLLVDMGISITPEEASLAHLALFTNTTVEEDIGRVFVLSVPFTIYFPAIAPLTEVRLYQGDTSLFSIPLEDFSVTSVYLGDFPFPFANVYGFKDFVNSMGFEFATDNIIVNSLADIFGTGGVLPLFDNDTPFIIFAWFIGVYLLHLLVDFLLFIPRIAHKWMKDCTGGD